MDLSNDRKINFRLRYEYTQLITLSQLIRGSHSYDLPASADKYTMTIDMHVTNLDFQVISLQEQSMKKLNLTCHEFLVDKHVTIKRCSTI